MALRIQPFAEADIPAVQAFNQRLRDGGSAWSFYDTPTPDWLAAPGPARRAYYLAGDDRDGMVRGGYVLKDQAFRLDGAATTIGNVQGPVSEGVVARRFAIVGGLMLKDSLERSPLQVAWGTSKQKAAVLEGSGWVSRAAPLFLRVERQGAFLRQQRLLDGRPPLRRLAALLAATGLAPLGLKLAWTLLAARAPGLGGVTAQEEEAGFGPWANEVWEKAAPSYRLIADRDAAALTCVMPPGAWPDAIPLKVSRNGAVIGWAALRDRRLADDASFGDLRAGSILDALALPGEEATVAAAASAHLRRRGVDLTGACFNHPVWQAALVRAGLAKLPNRRFFALSPALAAKVEDPQALLAQAHMTLIDGDGPRLF